MTARKVLRSAANGADGSFLSDTALIANQLAALGNESIADHDNITDLLEFEHGLDGVIGGDFAIAAAAAVTLAATGRIRWRRNGQVFETAMPATITLADDGDIAQNKYRSFRIEISDAGAVTAKAGGDTETTTAEQALLALSAVAQTASTVEIAYVTFNDETGAFNIGTTNTNDAENFTVHYCRMPRQRNAGLTVDMGAVLAIGSSNDEFSHGTVDAKTQGVAVAQIATDATQAFDNADIVTTSGKYGAHLFIVDLAGTDVIALAGTGLLEGVQTMDYDTLALANTALDNLMARIPAIFPVLGRMTNLTAKASFTYNTDDGAGTDGTFTFVSETFAKFTNAIQSGTGQGVDQPTIPPVLTNNTAIDTITTETGAPA